jgi:hypothetical protein
MIAVSVFYWCRVLFIRNVRKKINVQNCQQVCWNPKIDRSSYKNSPPGHFIEPLSVHFANVTASFPKIPLNVILLSPFFKVSRDSAVGIAIGYGLVD